MIGCTVAGEEVEVCNHRWLRTMDVRRDKRGDPEGWRGNWVTRFIAGACEGWSKIEVVVDNLLELEHLCLRCLLI